MRTGPIPRQNQVLEWIYEIRVIAYLTAAMAIFWLGLLTMIWLAEYLLYGVPLGEWLEARWYIALGIACLAIISLVLDRRKAQDAWRQLEIADPSATGQLSSRTPGCYLTGGLELSGVQVGPATVSLDATGITVWKRGARRAHISWQRVQHIDACEHSRGNRSARILLKKEGSHGPIELSIPWDPAIEACEQAASLLGKRPAY